MKHYLQKTRLLAFLLVAFEASSSHGFKPLRDQPNPCDHVKQIGHSQPGVSQGLVLTAGERMTKYVPGETLRIRLSMDKQAAEGQDIGSAQYGFLLTSYDERQRPLADAFGSPLDRVQVGACHRDLPSSYATHTSLGSDTSWHVDFTPPYSARGKINITASVIRVPDSEKSNDEKSVFRTHLVLEPHSDNIDTDAFFDEFEDFGPFPTALSHAETEAPPELDCEPGFSDIITYGVERCADVNECARGTHNCVEDATCENTEGSFTCTCDGRTCTKEVSQTAPTSLPESYDPELGRELTKPPQEDEEEEAPNTDGEPCDEGFVRAPIGYGGFRCTDIDECEGGLHTCSVELVCVNTEGSFQCATDQNGFLRRRREFAAVMDESTKGRGPRRLAALVFKEPLCSGYCDPLAACENVGTNQYECKCTKGYTGDGFVCLPEATQTTTTTTNTTTTTAAGTQKPISTPAGIKVSSASVGKVNGTIASVTANKKSDVKTTTTKIVKTTQPPKATPKPTAQTPNPVAVPTTTYEHTVSLPAYTREDEPMNEYRPISFAWTVNRTQLMAMMVLNATADWVALGLSEHTKSMTPSWCLIGFGSNGTVREAHLTAHNITGVHMVPANETSLYTTSVTGNGTFTVLTFVRKVPPSTSLQTNKLRVNFIYAFGKGPLGVHRNDSRGWIKLDLLSGEIIEINEAVFDGIQNHGMLMFFGIGVASPLAIMVARFVKPTTTSAIWFHVHWVLQLISIVLLFSGLIVILSTPGISFDASDPHMALGLIVVSLLPIQGLVALFRPKKVPGADQQYQKSRHIWEVAHRGAGYFIVVLGFSNVCVGLYTANANIWMSGLYSYFTLVFVLSYGVLWTAFSKSRYYDNKKATAKTKAVL